MYKVLPFSFRYHNEIKDSLYSSKEFSFPETGLVLIGGNSGSGKSTFLSLLKGIIPELISGQIDGEVKLKLHRKAVYLFQNPFTQVIHSNCLDEFYFSLENFEFEPEAALKLKDQMTKRFNLHDLWSKKTTHLSHGECQRLLLASLLALSPKILLLDEPTAFLDPVERSKFYDLLIELKENHLIILVDHHTTEIELGVDLFIHIDQNGELRSSSFLSIEKESLPISIHLPELVKSKNLTLEISHLKFSYSKFIPMIDIPNEVIKSGEIIVIRGKNGSGKSTLLKLISGFLPFESGKIQLRDGDKLLSKTEKERCLGHVFQNPESSFLFETLKEEVHGYDFGFTKDQLARPAYLFSEGQKRRISIFIQLACNKDIILYDEPTFGQDVMNIQLITETILELQKKNKIQIIISHDEDFLKSLPSRELKLLGHNHV